MTRWAEFEADAPGLAAAGRKLFYQYRVGLGYLATVRPDGGPRLHPVCVNLVEGGAYLLIGDSPKQRDLARDGRFALHSFSAEDRDDEFYVTGRALHRPDPELRERVVAAQVATGATSSGEEMLFELDLERVLFSEYKPRGEPDNWPPLYHRWSASER